MHIPISIRVACSAGKGAAAEQSGRALVVQYTADMYNL